MVNIVLFFNVKLWYLFMKLSKMLFISVMLVGEWLSIILNLLVVVIIVFFV